MGDGWDLFWLVTLGVAGGVLGLRTRLPLGGLIGALAAAGAYSVLSGAVVELGTGYRMGAQLLVGIAVGVTVTGPILNAVRKLLLPLVVFFVVLVAMSAALGHTIISRFGGVSALSGYLAAAPAGAVEMGSAALAAGVETEVVVLTHLVRIAGVALISSALLPVVRRRLEARESRGEGAEGEPDQDGTFDV